MVKNSKTAAGRRANRRKDKRKKRKQQKQQLLQAEAQAEAKRKAREEAEKEAKKQAEKEAQAEAKQKTEAEAKEQAQVEIQIVKPEEMTGSEKAIKPEKAPETELKPTPEMELKPALQLEPKPELDLKLNEIPKLVPQKIEKPKLEQPRLKLPIPPPPADDKIFDRLRENLPPVNNLLDFADLCNAEKSGVAISVEQFEEDSRPFGVKVRFNRALYPEPASISEWETLQREIEVQSRYLLTISSTPTLFDLGILNFEVANMSHEYEESYVILAIDWLVHDYLITPSNHLTNSADYLNDSTKYNDVKKYDINSVELANYPADYVIDPTP